MIFNIFKKELKETLRDRRTIMTMIVIPILLFPIILNLFTGISSKFQKDAENKEINIGLIADKDGFISRELNLMPEENNTCTIGVKKTIRNKGKIYIQYCLDLTLTE